MEVRIIKSRSFNAAGPLGPVTREFAVGDVVDLPDIHAHMLIAQGDATVSKPVKKSEPIVESDAPKTTAKRTTKK